ncbi:MAG: hypothetical protein ACYDEE_08935 [Ignavibacteriaceae bacterium]
MKYSFFKFIIILLLTLSPMEYSQSIGLSIGTSYYYIAKDINCNYLESPFKNILIQYNHEVARNLQISIMSGYGWTGYNFHTTSSNTQFAWVNELDVESKGFPIELELKFQHYLTTDSIFEPNIGIGIGYCNFNSSIKYVSQPTAQETAGSNLTTKGFSQYVEFGLSVRISNQLMGSLEFQKLILSSIKTSGDLSALGYPYTNGFEEDYPSSSGFSDVGITFGISYNL